RGGHHARSGLGERDGRPAWTGGERPFPRQRRRGRHDLRLPHAPGGGGHHQRPQGARARRPEDPRRTDRLSPPPGLSRFRGRLCETREKPMPDENRRPPRQPAPPPGKASAPRQTAPRGTNAGLKPPAAGAPRGTNTGLKPPAATGGGALLQGGGGARPGGGTNPLLKPITGGAGGEPAGLFETGPADDEAFQLEDSPDKFS